MKRLSAELINISVLPFALNLASKQFPTSRMCAGFILPPLPYGVELNELLKLSVSLSTELNNVVSIRFGFIFGKIKGTYLSQVETGKFLRVI